MLMTPHDMFPTPRAWAERSFNVQRWTEIDRGAISSNGRNPQSSPTISSPDSRGGVMAAGSHLPRVEVTSRAQLRAWLEGHNTSSASVWLVTWKKQDPERHLPYDAIVEEALCFGWVDSLPRKLDAERSMLLLSPRKRGSAWSAANKARIVRLIEDGKMAAAGLAAFEAAKADES